METTKREDLETVIAGMRSDISHMEARLPRVRSEFRRRNLAQWIEDAKAKLARLLQIYEEEAI